MGGGVFSESSLNVDVPRINPEVPLHRGFGLFCKNIWNRREMIGQFVKRDFRIKYRGSFLGYIWSLFGTNSACHGILCSDCSDSRRGVSEAAFMALWRDNTVLILQRDTGWGDEISR